MAKAKDGRLWIRLTVDFPDNPKIAGLSDSAFRMLVELICWSKSQLTDGFIPDGVMRQRWKTQSLTDSDSESLTELLTNSRTHPSLAAVEGGYQLHDYSQHQETKEQVEAQREKNRENGKRGGRPKKTQPLTQSLTDSGTQTKADDRRQTYSPTYVGEGVANAPTPTTKTINRGTRIPEDFTVTDRMREWAAINAPAVNIESATARFVDHWHAQSGQKAVKLDWTATWRNWLRSDQEKAEQQRSSGYRNQNQIMADIRRDAYQRTTMQGNALNLIEGGLT